MRRFSVGVGVVAAAVLAAGAGAQIAGHPAARAAEAKLKCKLAGVRFFGAGAGKASVCFTLSADRKRMREYDYTFCAAASDYALATDKPAKPVAVKRNGTFVGNRLYLGLLGNDLNSLTWVNVKFSGRISGNRASGLLTGAGGGSTIFRCTWSARRVR